MSQLGDTFDGFADDWDRFYGEDDARAFEYRQRHEIGVGLVAQNVLAGGRLMEVGCGAGHAACRLAEHGYRLTCVDVSEEMLAKTRKNFERIQRPVETFQAFAHEAPRGPFDGIYAFGVMDYVEDLQSTVEHLAGCLAPGGCLVLSFSNRQSPAEWFEAPLKRGLSRLLKRGKRVAQLAESGRTYPRSSAEVASIYERAGVTVHDERHLGFGVRFGDRWFPPRVVVERSDDALAESRLKTLGRTFFLVGQKK